MTNEERDAVDAFLTAFGPSMPNEFFPHFPHDQSIALAAIVNDYRQLRERLAKIEAIADSLHNMVATCPKTLSQHEAYKQEYGK